MVSEPGAVIELKLSCWASVMVTEAPEFNSNTSVFDIVAPAIFAPVASRSVSPVPPPALSVPVGVNAATLMTSFEPLPVTFCDAPPKVKVKASLST